jgi:hypothetical protein
MRRASPARRPGAGQSVPALAAAAALALAGLAGCRANADASKTGGAAASQAVIAPVPPPPAIAALPAPVAASAPSTAPSTTSSEAARAAAPAAFDPRRLTAARADLDAALGRGDSCDNDGECRSVAVGGKACGGPTGYRAYSAKSADPAAVERLAADERTLSQEESRASGRMSPCFMPADPGARCEAHRCVAGTASLVPPPAPPPGSTPTRSFAR